MGEPSTLFRAEALNAQTSHLYGRVKLLMPVRYAVAAAVALGLALSTLAFAYVGEYTKKARVVGVLVPKAGAAKVAATAGGLVLERLVKEGDKVQAGQALFVLSGERESEQGETALLIARQIDTRRAALEAEARANQSQLSIRADTLADRTRAIKREMSQLAAERELQAQRVSLAERTLKRYEDLAEKGFVPTAQVQQKQEELMEQQARLQALQRNETALRRERDSVQAQRKEIASQIRMAREQTARNVASLEQERVEVSARRRTLVLAPRAGTVTAISVEPGATVAAGGALATLLPEDETLEAHLYVPGRAAGFIEPGQEVLIRYEAYPYQKFGMGKGTVRDITRSPFSLAELPPNVTAAILVPTAQIANAQ